MKSSSRNPLTVLLGLVVAVALSACANDEHEVSSFVSHSIYRERIVEFGLDQTALGRRWLAEAERALTEPARLALPHEETGAWLEHEVRAIGVSLDAIANQVLVVRLEHAPLDDAGGEVAIYVDLFHVSGEPSEPHFTAVEPLIMEANKLRAQLPEDGRYVLRLQPELLASLTYRITIELDAALTFPVEGVKLSAVQSLFGDPRDAGARRHEGVDIFAPRDTPVIAVGDGRASARTNRLGGNVVWLTTSDNSYYYAHLERAAISIQRVKAGDVLGYVGNSGNAKTTAPHLHFGVYAGRRRPIDPLPRLRARRFDGVPSAWQSFMPHHVQITAAALNVREAPSMRGTVIAKLEQDAIVRGIRRSGAWLQVEIPQGMRGWVHTVYLERVDEPIAEWPAQADTWLVDSPFRAARPIAFIPAGKVLETLAITARGRLVRERGENIAGWLQEQASPAAPKN